MAAKTTAQAGNWSATATWTGGTLPAPGDTVTLNHAVTCDVDATVGSSPATGGTAAVRVAAGPFTVASGVTLVCRGDLSVANYQTINTHGTIELDASQAAAPSSTNYRFELGYLANWAGTGGTLRSNAGGNNARMGTAVNNGVNAASIVLTNMTFQRIGQSTGLGFNLVAETGDCILDGCTFDADCGSVSTSIGLATKRCEVVDCQFNQAVGQLDIGGDLNGKPYCFRLHYGAAPTGAGTRFIKRTSFAKNVYLFDLASVTIDQCVFGGFTYVNPLSSLKWAQFSRNYISYNDVASAGFNCVASISNCYFLANGHTDNWHALSMTAPDGHVLDGNVFDPFTLANATDVGEMFIYQDSATLVTGTIKNNLLLPSEQNRAASGLKACAGSLAVDASALTAPANYRIAFHHNTVYMEGMSYAVIASGESTGGGPGTPGWASEYRSNLGWSSTLGTSRHARWMDSQTDNDLIAPGTATHNASWNFVAGTGSNGSGFTFPASVPAGTDTITSDPGFVAPYRNIKTWAQSLGLSGSTATELKDAAIAYLRANPAQIDALLAHVRAGAAPTNAAYQADYETSIAGTSPTNGWIGAVEGVAATVSASRSRLVNAGAFGGSRAALVHAGGA
jgi:hypothetical protein